MIVWDALVMMSKYTCDHEYFLPILHILIPFPNVSPVVCYVANHNVIHSAFVSLHQRGGAGLRC